MPATLPTTAPNPAGLPAPIQPPGKLAAVNPAELWGAAGALALAPIVVATGIPTRLGFTPEETAAILLLVFVLVALARGTFQAWSSGKRGVELATTVHATAQSLITPEVASMLVDTLKPMIERMISERDARAFAMVSGQVSAPITRELPPTEPPREGSTR